MSSSDCSSSASSPRSSPLNKAGVPPSPPPPPLLGPLLSDEENDAMSDEYPDLDTSDEPADRTGHRSTTPSETTQSQDQSHGAEDVVNENLPPESSDASTSEGTSLANKEDGSPVAGPSSTRGASVAAKRGLRRVDPKSKKILKARLVPVRKSQLTPRMALYIPPHLQKQTQHVTPAPKTTVNSMAVALTPQQKHKEKEIYEKLKLVAKSYQQKQYKGFSKKLSRTTDHVILSESKKTKQAKKPLPAKLWTSEMENFLLTRNASHEKFVEIGDEDQLKETKVAKRKLRQLLRKARSKPSTLKNPYKILERTHEEYEKSDAFKKFKGSKAYEERKSRSCNDAGGSTSFDMSHDGVHLEEEYDSSFFLSLSQRHEARMEWSEAILEFNSSPANRLRSPPEIVKVEIIDSDDDSVQNESPTRVKSSSVSDKNSKRYGKFDSIGRSPNPSTPRSSKQSATSSTTQGSMDVSNNEYLNQQFLRRQHDYEREQKYQQIELASESREFPRGNSDNLFRGRDEMDDPLRLHPPVSPFPPMFAPSVNPNSIRFPPVFPIRNIYSPIRPLPEREPEEPFVGERRRRPHPALVASMLLNSNQPPVDLHGRNQAKVRRVRSSSPGSCYPIKEVNGAQGNRNLSLFRSSRENSPVVRNYSNERITSRDYPISRPLSPFSERIMRAAGKDSRRSSHDGRAREREDLSRQLSPFSERKQNRECSARRLSPFSERMRSRENIDRHNSPGRESNVKSEIVQYPLRKSTSHQGGREFHSDRPGDDRSKISSRRVGSTGSHGAFVSRDNVHQRGSGADRHEAQWSRQHRRDREVGSHVPQCPGLAVQAQDTDTSKKASSRRRDGETDLMMVSGNLSRRNHEVTNKIDSRKHSESRKRARDESSSRTAQSLGKRQRR